ncbi:MAG: carboxypeptidase-like regulatory domain-containing protein, partial [Bacteroidetes bacterium]|nr:carboxypeptidase-like regulatory domain-containing protein [Bacteroidota bacterium]
MRYTVFVWIFLLPGVCSICSAQPGTLRGHVVDEETGEPLEFVNVFLAGTTSGTSSDPQGA